MKKPPHFFKAAALLGLLWAAPCPAAGSSGGEDAGAALKFFENEVRPILANRCYECHGEKKQKGGLRADGIQFLKAGGENGPALVPGKPDESPLIEAVRYAKTDFQMPPKQKLPEAEIQVLEKWVRLGAPWPSTGTAPAPVGEGGFTEEHRKFWCFQPLANPEAPAAGEGWARTGIDRFIAGRHLEMGLRPAAEADRGELLRRLTMDVHGLPPSAEQAAAFLADDRPDAYERLVDSLLESPHYGERWAQHWLDLVRYAESDGYNADEFRPAAWPYRDYVIRSLNEDKPYDVFVREQLAGDEIAPGDPSAMSATGYLRNPIYEWNQADVRGQWEIILTDITDTTGELFLGLSFGCARCHNHKFDPILQKDYFRLRAFFEPVQWRDDLKLADAGEMEAFTRKQQEWEEATRTIREKMGALVNPLVENSVERALKRFNDELQGMVRKNAGERAPLEQQLVNLCERQLQRARRTFDPMKSLKGEEAKTKYAALAEELKGFERLKPKAPMEAFVATDVGPVAPPTLLKTRKGEQQVAPGFLTLLEPGEAVVPPLKNSTGRRTALAEWISRPDNQLSTRVIVNRVWQYHFGRGLVATSSDFGKLGEKPSHPELLDWMARRFVQNGWSLKKLHREILLSAVYRQTARREPSEFELKTDPTNKYLWRFHPRRLDAEQVRDAMLAASGELDLKQGGPPEDGNGMRRSIYTIKKRNNQNELLRSMDAPAGFASASERQSTTTPTQALLLLNGDWALNRARKLSARVKSPEEAWVLAYGRTPDAQERALVSEFLKKRMSAHDKPPASAAPAAAPAEVPGLFRERTDQERLLAKLGSREGDEFTVEAVFQLESIDTGAAVRTLASRWAGAKDSLEAYGWSLGVTGEKSRFKPRNLIVQLVGEDENFNTAYEVVASNLRVELGRRYHAVVRVSCAEHGVRFTLRDLGQPEAPAQSALVPIVVRSKLSQGTSTLAVGGLSKRAPGHHWDGRIEALRIVPGALPEQDASPDAASWKTALLQWNATAGPGALWSWSGEGKTASDSPDAKLQALTDLCQVLLNSSEFLYLH